MQLLDGVDLGYGGTPVLAGVRLHVAPGERVALLGRSGSGKSTLLSALHGAAAGRGMRIALVPQDPVIFATTARENIRYFGELHGLTKAEIDARTQVLSDQLDMGEILDRQTEGFSQGQRTKTAIARALVHDPRNVILDEPTNGLDVMTTRAMREFLFKLRDDGRCVIFSSHIMQEVAALCDRIVIIAKGRVVADGSADELRARFSTDNLEDAFVRAIGTDEGLLA